MKKVFLVCLALALPVTSSTTLAAPRLSAQSIIVNPVRTDLAVQVWTDRTSNASGIPDYQVGDTIRIYASVNRDAYVYLFNIDPDGTVNLILPNNLSDGANYLRAGEVRAFPGAQDAFSFDIVAPYGVNKVLALASAVPLNLNNVVDFQTQNAQATGFADVRVTGQPQLAQALSIAVRPLSQNAWVSDVALYNVADEFGNEY